MMSGAQVQELLVLLTMKNGLSGPAGQAIASTRALESGAVGMAGSVAGAEARVGLLGRATSGAGQALGHFGGVIGGVTRATGLLGGTIALFAGPALIGGAIKSAVDFQQQMMLIQTQAHASGAEVKFMTKAVLDMAPAVGVGPIALAQGLYHIESVGFRGAKALDILKLSAEGARVGMASMEDVSNALAAAMRSGIIGTTGTAMQTMSTLNAIIGAGNMRMTQLTGAMGTGILSSARAAGLTLTDVGAALAVMTDQGANANQAATRIATTFSLMAAPSSVAVKALKAMGMSQTSLAVDLRKPEGLLVALRDIRTHLEKIHGGINQSGKSKGDLGVVGEQLISAAFGRSRQSRPIIQLFNNPELLAQKYAIIAGHINSFNKDIAATATTDAQKYAVFQASIEKLGIEIGGVLSPAFANLAVAGGAFINTAGPGIVGGMAAITNGAGVLFGVLGHVAEAIGTIVHIFPPAGSALEILAGAALAGKASSILFGKNPFTWLLSQVGGKLGLGGKGGVGGIVGGLGVTHVWVDNMGPGGMGGGAGGAAGAAESRAGMLATVMSFVPAIIAATVAVGLYTQVLDPLNKKIQSQVADNAAKAKNFMQDATLAQLQNALKGVQAQRDSIDPITAALDLNGARSGTDKIIADLKARIAADEKNNTAGPGGSTIGTPQVWVSVRDLRAALMSPKIKDVGGSADILTKEILSKSGGSIPTLESIRSVLQRQLLVALKKGDIVTVNIIAGDIAKIGTRIDTVTQQRLAAANASRPRGDFIGLNPSLGLGLNLGPRRDQAKQPDVTSAIHTAADTQNRAVAAMKQRISDLNTTTSTGLGVVAARVAGGDSILVAAINAVEAAVRAIPGINISPRATDLAAGGQYSYGRTPPGVGARPGSHPGRGGQAG